MSLQIPHKESGGLFHISGIFPFNSIAGYEKNENKVE